MEDNNEEFLKLKSPLGDEITFKKIRLNMGFVDREVEDILRFL